MENRILERDGFGPTEEECLGEKNRKFMHLHEFQIMEEDITFIDECCTLDLIF